MRFSERQHFAHELLLCLASLDYGDRAAYESLLHLMAHRINIPHDDPAGTLPSDARDKLVSDLEDVLTWMLLTYPDTHQEGGAE